MLPKSYQDFTALMELPSERWRDLFAAAGDHGRLPPGDLTHREVWQHLVREPHEPLLLDALEVVADLGTEQGQDLLLQAAADQRVDLHVGHEEPARELAVRVWIESRTDERVMQVLVRARVQANDIGATRIYREFVARG